MATARQVTGSDGRVLMSYQEAKAISSRDLFGERVDLTSKSDPIMVQTLTLGKLMSLETGAYYIVGYALYDHKVPLDEEITIKQYKHMRKYISNDYEVYQSGRLYKLTKRSNTAQAQ